MPEAHISTHISFVKEHNYSKNGARDYEFETNGNYVLVGLCRSEKYTLLYKIILDLVASGMDWDHIFLYKKFREAFSEVVCHHIKKEAFRPPLIFQFLPYFGNRSRKPDRICLRITIKQLSYI